MHSYYHLVSLICYCCTMGYLSDSVVDMVSRFKSFSEAPCLAQKCGTRRSDNPIRAL
jgi:hypothetical protein